MRPALLRLPDPRRLYVGLWVALWSLALASGLDAQPQSAESNEEKPVAAKTEPALRFVDKTTGSGIDFSGPHSKDKKYILESVSGGVAVFDMDGDGRLDVFLVGSSTVDRERSGKAVPSALYRNLGDFKFEDVSRAAGIRSTGWGVGVCVADVDGNGRPDLYVTGVGGNRLFLNQDGKTFKDVAVEAGVVGGGWSTGCTFADVDRDGDLDLFVARYLDMGLDKLPEFGRGELCKYRGIPVQCGPRGLPGQSDLFFRNQGDGTFKEDGRAAGLSDPDASFGLGATFFDADGDTWPDLYVANDTQANFLYLNKKDGTFEEMSFLLGVAVSEDGKEQGSMGVAVGDYGNEGFLSLFVTNYAEEYNAFYHNENGEFFSDASFQTQTAAPSVRHVGWGTAFFDADNDLDLDLLLVNGHVYPQMDAIRLEASAPYKQRRMLFRNRGKGVFGEVIDEKGPLAELTVSRGLAVGDLDNDGLVDAVITDLDGKAQVLRNVTEDAGNWLQVELDFAKEGWRENRTGVGAVLRLKVGKTILMRPVLSGTSYLSQDAQRVHFGLGRHDKVERLDVQWPDGSVTQVESPSVNQILTVKP